MRIGAHVSAAGRIDSTITRAIEIGAECFQFFPSAPQSWRRPAHSATAVAAFREQRARAALGPAFFHSVYLINLASDNSDLREKSMLSLVTYLEWADRLGVDGVITHLGSARNVGIEEGLALVVDALAFVLEAAPGEAQLLLETTAGSGAIVGSRFEELGHIINALGRPPRAQVCLDTAHVFAAGLYDGTPEGLDAMVNEFDRAIGLERLRAVHLNDSASAYASRVDRHANLGTGKLGFAGLRPFFAHPAFAEVPFIMEVPGARKQGPELADVKLAKALARGEVVEEEMARLAANGGPTGDEGEEAGEFE